MRTEYSWSYNDKKIKWQINVVSWYFIEFQQTVLGLCNTEAFSCVVAKGILFALKQKYIDMQVHFYYQFVFI